MLLKKFQAKGRNIERHFESGLYCYAPTKEEAKTLLEIAANPSEVSRVEDTGKLNKWNANFWMVKVFTKFDIHLLPHERCAGRMNPSTLGKAFAEEILHEDRSSALSIMEAEDVPPETIERFLDTFGRAAEPEQKQDFARAYMNKIYEELGKKKDRVMIDEAEDGGYELFIMGIKAAHLDVELKVRNEGGNSYQVENVDWVDLPPEQLLEMDEILRSHPMTIREMENILEGYMF